MKTGHEFVCLLNGTQKMNYLALEGLSRARRQRRHDGKLQALIEFRLFDPPAFQCQNCEAPFALLSHYNGHSCSSPFEQLIDRDINLTNQWAEVRLHEELQKISATQLMDAMLQ